MVEIWVNPADNRIMAEYSHSTTSQEWVNQGYVKYNQYEPWMLPRIPPPPPVELRMSLHEAQITAINTALVRPITATVHQDGNQFPIDCFVTQDLVDAFQAGNLAVGDWVLIYFIDHREDKAIAQQKIFKTW